MSDTFDRLQAILVKDYKAPPGSLTPESLLDGLGIDSLGTVELLWSIEEVFGINLPPEPVALATVGDVVGYIDGLFASQRLVAADAPDGVLQRAAS